MSETQSPILLQPTGRLDANTSKDFEKEVLEQLSQSPDGAVMDFSELRYVSSAGLRVVLLAAKKVKATGTVKEVDGKMQLTATKIELVKD